MCLWNVTNYSDKSQTAITKASFSSIYHKTFLHSYITLTERVVIYHKEKSPCLIANNFMSNLGHFFFLIYHKHVITEVFDTAVQNKLLVKLWLCLTDLDDLQLASQQIGMTYSWLTVANLQLKEQTSILLNWPPADGTAIQMSWLWPANSNVL